MRASPQKSRNSRRQGCWGWRGKDACEELHLRSQKMPKGTDRSKPTMSWLNLLSGSASIMNEIRDSRLECELIATSREGAYPIVLRGLATPGRGPARTAKMTAKSGGSASHGSSWQSRGSGGWHGPEVWHRPESWHGSEGCCVCCLLFVVCCLLFVVCCLLFAACCCLLFLVLVSC